MTVDDSDRGIAVSVDDSVSGTAESVSVAWQIQYHGSVCSDSDYFLLIITIIFLFHVWKSDSHGCSSQPARMVF